MFDPNAEDEVWKNQEQWEITKWELFDSCGIHVLHLSNGLIFYMLNEKKYPLTADTMTRMLHHRLYAFRGDYLAYDLLRSFIKWIQEENAAKGPTEGEGSSKSQNP